MNKFVIKFVVYVVNFELSAEEIEEINAIVPPAVGDRYYGTKEYII
jgi:hypothetical protein